MISAILEISVMLLVAFGLGAFLVHFNWKKKYNLLEEELNELKESHQKLNKEFQQAKNLHQRYQEEKEAEIKEGQTQLNLVKKNIKEAQKELQETRENHQKELQNLNVELEKARTDLQQEKNGRSKEVELLKADLRKIEEEREILTRELGDQEQSVQKKKRSARYYRTIGDKKYDDAVLKVAEKAVSGRGDGRISVADADQLFETIADSNQYTDVEKATIKYIRENFTWTPGADEQFRKRVREWVAERTV